MSELNKTTLFFVAAIAAVGLALFTRPSTEEYNVEERRGTLLVDEFPSDAPKRLTVTTMNEETGDVDTFEVAEIDGVWSIPSRSGYPADATEQMASAVEGVVDRQILDVVDSTAGDHATYGVVDPEDSSADTGFGTHVQLTGADDQVLADLVIGNEVKDQPGQYYVRQAKQDVVYTTEIDLGKFSTDFGDWIEKDLLGLSTFDVGEVDIDDYSIEMRLEFANGSIRPVINEDRRARMHLVYNDDESKWEAKSLEVYNQDSGKYETFELGENEELNADTLRELKNALDDLVIVDVEKKPDGLSGDLQAGEDFMQRRDALESLASRGFLPMRKSPNSNELELQSSEGQVTVTLNDGVEYVLRFGDLQLDAAESGEDPAAAKAEAEASAGDEGLNRYLFVMARFDEAAIEKPELEELPELPSDDSASSEQPEGESGDAAESPEDGSDEADTEESGGESGESADESDAESDTDEGEDQSDEESADESTEDESAEEQPSREEIELERKRITENNNRAEEEYKEKIEKGQERVAELNARFGDWYYVIPNDVFKKIHLGRDQVIKTTEPAEDEESDDAEAESDESSFGAAGSAIPGLPSPSAGGESSTGDDASADGDASSDEEPAAGEQE